MPPKKKITQRTAGESRGASPEPAVVPEDDISFDTELLERVSGIALSGVSATSALDLISRLLLNVPAANKGEMDKIKLMDKLINSARHMIETKLKTDDLPAIMKRLDEMEAQIDGAAPSELPPWIGADIDASREDDHG
jgi:hypothetical protein